MNEAFGSAQGRLQMSSGIETLFPFLPKSILSGIRQMEMEEKNKIKMKTRPSLGISNIVKPADKPKKPNTT
jgi:hypothetical protein